VIVLNEFIREIVLAAEKGQFKILQLLFINHRRFPDFKTASGKQHLCFIEIERYDHKTQETVIEAKKDIFNQHLDISLVWCLTHQEQVENQGIVNIYPIVTMG